MSPLARSFAAAFAFDLARLQSVPPSLESRAVLSPFSSVPPPMYFATRSSCVAGTYSVSLPA